MPSLRMGRTTIAAAIATCFIALDLAHAQPVDELIRHVPGDGDVLIRRTEDIPPLVRDALKGPPFACRLAERVLNELPIITFQPAPGFLPMTLVPCESYVLQGRALLFERGLDNAPSVMKFEPRLLIWNANSKELIGYAFTDMIAERWYVGRSIYRHVGGSGLNGLALVGRERGEITKDGFKNWQPIPEALPGPAPNR